MDITKQCSHPLPSTPTHSHPLPPTSIHSHLLPPTPTHPHPLPSTSTHSHPLPSTPIHSLQLPPNFYLFTRYKVQFSILNFVRYTNTQTQFTTQKCFEINQTHLTNKTGEPKITFKNSKNCEKKGVSEGFLKYISNFEAKILCKYSFIWPHLHITDSGHRVLHPKLKNKVIRYVFPTKFGCWKRGGNSFFIIFGL